MTQNAGIHDDPFSEGGTLPEQLPESPWGIYQDWWDQEHSSAKAARHPNAFNLATADEAGQPSNRVVYCKRQDLDAGWICFFTNYTGRKAEQIEKNPNASASFFWLDPDRQVRIEGAVTRSPASESDDYFASRALISRLGAWASDQSKPVESRDALLAHYAEVMERFDVPLDAMMDEQVGKDIVIPRPEFWGGYRIWARRVELWIGGAGRFHDRAVWTRELTASGDGFVGSDWSATRLAP